MAQNECQEYNKVMTRAVAEYQAEQAKTGKKQGLHAVCFDIQKQYLQETGKVISLNHNTLNNLAKGGHSISEFNAEKRWLLDAKEENISEYTLDHASHGFPLDHKQLKAAVDDIAQARLGDDFPESGVGKQWTGRFIERHSDCLHMYGTRGLDKSRTQAVNKTTNAAWYEMLGTLLKTGDDGKSIALECIWGVDETGFQPCHGVAPQKVVGPTGAKVQYQAVDGNRENITVLVTIGADGTSIPPAVIFKGKAYQAKWLQDNPTNAM